MTSASAGGEGQTFSAQRSLPQAAAFPQLASGAARVSAPGRLDVYKLDHSHILEAIGGAWAGTVPSLPVISQQGMGSFSHLEKQGSRDWTPGPYPQPRTQARPAPV